MRGIVALEKCGLADEEVGALRDRGELLRPTRITGIGDELSRYLDAEAMGLGEADVPHGQRGHPRSAELGRLGAEHNGIEREAECCRPEEVGVERLLLRAEALLERGRPADDEWLLASGEVLLDHEERNAAEVIAVEVRDGDRVDRFWVDVLLDTGERGAAAVEQQRDTRCGDVDRGVHAAAIAECTSASEELHADGHAISLSAIGRRSLSDRRAASAIRSASMPSRTVHAFSTSPRAKRRKCASSARYAASKRTKKVGYAGSFIFGPSRSTDDIGVRGSSPTAIV